MKYLNSTKSVKHSQKKLAKIQVSVKKGLTSLPQQTSTSTTPNEIFIKKEPNEDNRDVNSLIIQKPKSNPNFNHHESTDEERNESATINYNTSQESNSSFDEAEKSSDNGSERVNASEDLNYDPESPYMKAVTQRQTASRLKLSRVRSSAEEGPLFLQGLAFFGSIGMIFSSMNDFYTMINDQNVDIFENVDKLLILTYSWMFGIFIFLLEGRSFQLHIVSFHYNILGLCKLFRFLWGRGLLYLFIGSLHFSLLTFTGKVVGGYMVVLGIISFLIGFAANSKLQRLRKSILNEIGLEAKFQFHDRDRDGYMRIDDFRDFIYCEMSDLSEDEIISAFHFMDKNNDNLISFKDLQLWWDIVKKEQQKMIDNVEANTYYLI